MKYWTKFLQSFLLILIFSKFSFSMKAVHSSQQVDDGNRKPSIPTFGDFIIPALKQSSNSAQSFSNASKSPSESSSNSSPESSSNTSPKSTPISPLLQSNQKIETELDKTKLRNPGIISKPVPNLFKLPQSNQQIENQYIINDDEARHLLVENLHEDIGIKKENKIGNNGNAASRSADTYSLEQLGFITSEWGQADSNPNPSNGVSHHFPTDIQGPGTGYNHHLPMGNVSQSHETGFVPPHLGYAGSIPVNGFNNYGQMAYTNNIPINGFNYLGQLGYASNIPVKGFNHHLPMGYTGNIHGAGYINPEWGYAGNVPAGTGFIPPNLGHTNRRQSVGHVNRYQSRGQANRSSGGTGVFTPRTHKNGAGMTNGKGRSNQLNNKHKNDALNKTLMPIPNSNNEPQSESFSNNQKLQQNSLQQKSSPPQEGQKSPLHSSSIQNNLQYQQKKIENYGTMPLAMGNTK